MSPWFCEKLFFFLSLFIFYFLSNTIDTIITSNMTCWYGSNIILTWATFIKHQAQQVISIVMKNIVDGYVYNIS